MLCIVPPGEGWILSDSRRSMVGYILVVGLESEIGARRRIVRRKRLNIRLGCLDVIRSRAIFYIFSCSCTGNVTFFPNPNSKYCVRIGEQSPNICNCFLSGYMGI